MENASRSWMAKEEVLLQFPEIVKIPMHSLIILQGIKSRWLESIVEAITRDRFTVAIKHGACMRSLREIAKEDR